MPSIVFKKLSEYDQKQILTGLEDIVALDETGNIRINIGVLRLYFLNILNKTHVGLANVDNTADINKPISNDVSAALNDLAAQFNLALTQKSNTGHNHSINSLLDVAEFIQAINDSINFAIENHTHDVADLNGLMELLNNEIILNHNHEIIDINGLQTALTDLQTLITESVNSLTTSLNSLQDIVLGKANSDHTHSIANIVGLSEALLSKAASDHTHSASAITDFATQVNSLIGIAITNLSVNGHTHEISEINGLSTSLNNLNTAISDLSNVVSNLSIPTVPSAGMVKSNGTVFQTAVAATDYVSPDEKTQFSKTQVPSKSSMVVPSAGSVTWDLNIEQIKRINLATNLSSLTILNLDSSLVGCCFILVLRSNGGTVAFPSSMKFVDDVAPTIPATAGKMNILTFMVDTPDDVNYYLYLTGSTTGR